LDRKDGVCSKHRRVQVRVIDEHLIGIGPCTLRLDDSEVATQIVERGAVRANVAVDQLRYCRGGLAGSAASFSRRTKAMSYQSFVLRREWAAATFALIGRRTVS
jgi:hypothetical protein